MTASRNQAKRRTMPEYTTKRSWMADRAAEVRPEVKIGKTGANGSCRAGRRSTGRPVGGDGIGGATVNGIARPKTVQECRNIRLSQNDRSIRSQSGHRNRTLLADLI